MKKTLANNFLKLPPEILPFICKNLDHADLSNLIKIFKDTHSILALKEVELYMKQNFKIIDTSKETITIFFKAYDL